MQSNEQKSLAHSKQTLDGNVTGVNKKKFKTSNTKNFTSNVLNNSQNNDSDKDFKSSSNESFLSPIKSAPKINTAPSQLNNTKQNISSGVSYKLIKNYQGKFKKAQVKANDSNNVSNGTLKFKKANELKKDKKKQSFTKTLIKEVGLTTKDSIKNGIKNGVNRYKEELEKDDVGVQVAGKLISTTRKTAKFVKKNKAAIQNKRELRIKKTQLKKQKDKSIKQNIKNTKKNVKKAIFTTIDKGINTYQKNLERDDLGVDVASKGAKLTKQSVALVNRTRKKLKEAKDINSSKTKKLHRKKPKLAKKGVNQQKKVVAKQQLKKKIVKRKMYNPATRRKLVRNGIGAIGKVSTATINFLKTFKMVAIKKAIASKIAIWASGGLATLLPILLVLGLLIGIIILIGIGGGGQQPLNAQIGATQNLSPEVEKWRDLVTKEAEAQGMSNYVSLILAIIQVESGGRGTRDIMQSSESAGYPPNTFQTEEDSVRQGIKYLKSIIEILQGFGQGYENNAKLIAQAYNFGSPFARYVGKRGGTYDLSVAEAYSKDVVAPSLGNHNGTTYNYVNTISQSVGKTYLYRNGGNYLYGELVGQYIGGVGVSGDFATVLAEIEKYNGWSYVWGGKSPTTGFDCSGLVSWGLKQIGINLSSPASNQYTMTVPISPSEAKAGDLIFFRGTYGDANHISHVGFYIDENTMYDANGSGVGYHNWKSAYWQKHNPEIRRIVQ